MSNSLSKIHDEIKAEELEQNKDFLQKLANDIKNINIKSQTFCDLKWLYNNKERILNNKSLIELLGK